MYIYQDKSEIDFHLDNQLLVEIKYHEESITEKQKKLAETFSSKDFIVARNEQDIEQVIRWGENRR